MPRPPVRKPGEGQGDMFADDDDFKRFTVNTGAQEHRGRVSAEIDAAFAAATEQELVREEHRALMAIVRHGGWAMDNFEATNKPYGASKLIQPMTEALRELNLTPAAQADAVDDSLKVLLNDIARPSRSEVSHPEESDA